MWHCLHDGSLFVLINIDLWWPEGQMDGNRAMAYNWLVQHCTVKLYSTDAMYIWEQMIILYFNNIYIIWYYSIDMWWYTVRKLHQSWWVQFSSALVRVLVGWHQKLAVMCFTQTSTLWRLSSTLSNICIFVLLFIIEGVLKLSTDHDNFSPLFVNSFFDKKSGWICTCDVKKICSHQAHAHFLLSWSFLVTADWLGPSPQKRKS